MANDCFGDGFPESCLTETGQNLTMVLLVNREHQTAGKQASRPQSARGSNSISGTGRRPVPSMPVFSQTTTTVC